MNPFFFFAMAAALLGACVWAWRERRRRVRLEQSLLERQRLESLGLLAGGLAHDFNNFLGVILAHTQLARARVERLAATPSPTDENGAEASEAPVQAASTPSPASGFLAHLQAIEQAGLHAAALCRQTLAYSKRESAADLSAVDLNEAITGIGGLLRQFAPAGGGLVFQLAPGLPPVRGNATELRQAVVNLVINAAQAVGRREAETDGAALKNEGKHGGKIIITTRGGVSAENTKSSSPPGVWLEIADNGAGMSAAVQAKLWAQFAAASAAPFFTAKPGGHGLGLAAVRRVLRDGGGTLALESREGAGTTWRLFFPAALP